MSEYAWAAAAYHLSSSFDHFAEPQPPYTLSEPIESGAVSSNGHSPRHSADLQDSFFKLFAKRVSERNFGTGHLRLEHLRLLLWAAYGCVEGAGELERRTVPSAGALYPLYLRTMVIAAENLVPGVYDYSSRTDSLILRPEINLPAQPSDWFRTKHVDYNQAAAIVFFVGQFDRICPKYGERGYRYMLLEAGHAAQNLCLAASALRVPHVPVGGFDDDLVNAELGLVGRWDAVVYSMVLGRS